MARLQQLEVSSSTSSSNKKTNSKFPQWPGGGRDGSVGISATMINRAQGLRLKRRSDLYKFAQDYPGGLGALFLIQLRQKLMSSPPEKVKDLYAVDPCRWGACMTGLKEIRDLREVQCLSKLVAQLNANRLPQALDLACQRIREIMLAKKAGGSWEKAALVSLLPSDQASMLSALPDGCLDL